MTQAIILAPTPRRLSGRTIVDHVLDRLAEAHIDCIFAISQTPDAHPALRPLPPAPDPAPDLAPDPAPDRAADPAEAIRQALATGDLAPEPFFLIDGNVAWFDGPLPALGRLVSAMHAETAPTDALTLLIRATEIGAHLDRPNLMLDPLGLVRRPPDHAIAPFVAAGLSLLTPAYLTPPGSLDDLRRSAIESGRLRGLVHDGIWFDLATDDDLAEAEATLEDRLAGTRS